MPQQPPAYAPTVRGRRLARILRQYRLDAELKAGHAAAQLGWSPAKMSHIESGRSKPRVDDVAAALALYGVSSPDREALIQLARDIDQRGWWTDYLDVFTGSYVALEDEASKIREVQLGVVPGLLQTEDYAYALERTGASHRGDGEEGVRRRVQARMARRTLLRRMEPAAPDLHVIIDEAVLRRPVGGRDVMRDQLHALKAAAARPNITVQVMPLDVGAHPGLDGSFIVLSYPEDIDPDIAYVEGRHGDVYLENALDLARVRLDFQHISERALSPDGSEEFIARVISSI